MTYDAAEQHARSAARRQPSEHCIVSRGYDRMDWVLVHKDSKELAEMDEVVESRDAMEWTIVGGNAPHKPSSTGRVQLRGVNGNVRGFAEFFPSVVGLEWVPVIDFAREG